MHRARLYYWLNKTCPCITPVIVLNDTFYWLAYNTKCFNISINSGPVKVSEQNSSVIESFNKVINPALPCPVSRLRGKVRSPSLVNPKPCSEDFAQ